MVSSVTTNSKAMTQSGQKRFWKGNDGYIYCFYVDNTDGYQKVKSSLDGITWGVAANCSHAALGYNWDASLFDGTYFWVAYQVGASAWGGVGATIWARRGTASGGTITWDAQVTVIAAVGGYFGGNFCKTTNKVWLAFIVCAGGVGAYHHYVYDATDGSAWTQRLDFTLPGVDSGYHTIPQITSAEHVGVDYIMMVWGYYSVPNFSYRIWTGAGWTVAATFAERPIAGRSYGSAWIRDLWTANGEIHFVYLYGDGGGPIRYRRYTNVWENYVEVDASTDNNPTISNDSDKLRVFYRRHALPTVIYYREMDYTAHTFGGELTAVSGEPNNMTYPSAQKSVSSVTLTCGFTWQTGAAAPYTYRFGSITLVVAPTVTTQAATLIEEY